MCDLREGVKLGDSIVECLLGKMTSTIRRVENLVVEDGEVECQTQSDRVSWWQFSDSNIRGVLVCLERLLSGIGSLGTSREFCEISVVVALPRMYQNCS